MPLLDNRTFLHSAGSHCLTKRRTSYFENGKAIRWTGQQTRKSGVRVVRQPEKLSSAEHGCTTTNRHQKHRQQSLGGMAADCRMNPGLWNARYWRAIGSNQSQDSQLFDEQEHRQFFPVLMTAPRREKKLMKICNINASNRLRMGSMLAVLSMVLWTGCAKLQSGGGSRSMVSGEAKTLSVYGYDDGKKLKFVLFTDQSLGDSATSTSARWKGSIIPQDGKEVSYQGSATGITIDGTQYSFTNGRVFLVSRQSDTVSIRQLDIALEDTMYRTELDRLSKTEEVESFLRQ